jgi:hypothetical protein
MTDVATICRPGYSKTVRHTSGMPKAHIYREYGLDKLAQASVSLDYANARTESRGAHWREDFPKRNDQNWLKHTLAWLDDEGHVRLAFRPVRLQPLSNEVDSIAPKERVC